MFSSYVKAHNRFPSIVVSFQEQSSGFIHSCHFVLEGVPAFSVTFIMLVTYTENGVRLSCTEFEGHTTLRLVQESRINYLMEEHFRVSYLSGGVKNFALTNREEYPDGGRE